MKTGILFINVGTPRAPQPQEVGEYLSEFLNDPDVMRMPALVRKILVDGIIIPRRKKTSAHAYQKVWTEQGSPLLAFSKQLVESLNQKLPEPYRVYLGMRYSTPSLSQVIGEMKNDGVEKLVVFPLYPQYARATTGTSIRRLREILGENHQGFKSVHYAPAFYNEDFFIEPLVKQIRSLPKKFDHVLLSYHGLPESHIYDNSHCQRGSENCCLRPKDEIAHCYKAQCYQTTLKLVRELELKSYSHAYQSRLGRGKWIGPTTSDTLAQLGKKGVENLLVLCPSFVTDCLETLEEIAIAGKATFIENGGKNFEILPCLNADSLWVDKLKMHILKNY